MKKKILALAAAVSLLAYGAASADWQAGAENKLFVSGGSAAARMTLTQQQQLKAVVDAKAETAALTFTYGGAAEAEGYTLTLPCPATTENASVTVTPLVDTGSGKRFYAIATGAPEGCLIVSYGNKAYGTAFDAGALGGGWTAAELEIGKKALVLHLTDAEGNTESVELTYDKKQNLFTADGVDVSVVEIEEQ